MVFSYLLMSLVSYSGIFIGFALALIAPEELTKKTKKYFSLTASIIISSGISLLLYNLYNPKILCVIAFAFVWAVVFAAIRASEKALRAKANRKANGRMLPYLIYLLAYNLSPLALFISYGKGYFISMNYLVFILGFPVGSLICFRQIKNSELRNKRQAFADIVRYTAYFPAMLLLLSLASFLAIKA